MFKNKWFWGFMALAEVFFFVNAGIAGLFVIPAILIGMAAYVKFLMGGNSI